MQVGAIHAGLECGLLGDKIPGLDMVSYGPTIRYPLGSTVPPPLVLAGKQSLLQDQGLVSLQAFKPSMYPAYSPYRRCSVLIYDICQPFTSLIFLRHFFIGGVLYCRGAHSPDEMVQISTVEPFWITTLQLLGRLADVKS